MNDLTKKYIGNHKFTKISSDIFAVRGEYETVFIYERGERSFFASFRLRFTGPEHARRPATLCGL